MYEILRNLESNALLDDLVKQGIVSITIAGHKMIYEVYLKELKTVKKTQAITNASIDTKTPERTIYRIIKKMESK
ncbi:hypothetical protein RYR30_001943 [Flavobacterium psychrophilum]|uniref:hypothetical protein n=1 Tax=Flavobacterium psychrophilum TaxID=96345 RepID=UPI000B7C128B|nr:hypothetical protein [Flavobacterium psychrophilum]EKT3962766.1 hypothetical protein [Flavobacterium psychrophilum]EKT4500947.1 hypothetical protein [Flavobacterium psychrophilum]EKT4508384.1 hypothetical protein [Flavobacterium psychrophilum]EKT4545825.1 hypothetical protein [Flavobacterium psychrophilum]EKT4550405.1 hypothetical protein [Flavobacterium psychrophilum]